ncbi:LacI family DNA-binding transcriptional regulator [Tabrizicola sp.]|uniref:LacI family DNA-binding transcriptional regulator n=1 Tax=Tabrizicola sp. TaxID=2005166 RepID=UPI003F3B27E8
MTDVARLAGCSQATVSFVLNNAPGVKISERMRSRVIEAALSLNYAQTKLAHHATEPADQSARAGVVGFVVDQLATSPEAVVAIESARQALWADGELLFATQTMNDPELEDATIDTLAAQGMVGLIYMTIFTRKVQVSPRIRKLPIPVVLLNCYSDDDRFPSVVPAELDGGQRATEHLILKGHRRIGMITGEPWMEATRDRLKGYRRSLAAADIPFDPTLVVQGNWSPSAGYDCTRRLLALPNRPTAIFCQNDRMAIGCYEALKEAGLRIPDDISVIGYDDEEIARHLYPQLTTVVLPHRAMAHWAVETLAELRSGAERSAGGVVKVSGPLIERDSVAAAR